MRDKQKLLDKRRPKNKNKLRYANSRRLKKPRRRKRRTRNVSVRRKKTSALSRRRWSVKNERRAKSSRQKRNSRRLSKKSKNKSKLRSKNKTSLKKRLSSLYNSNSQKMKKIKCRNSSSTSRCKKAAVMAPLLKKLASSWLIMRIRRQMLQGVAMTKLVPRLKWAESVRKRSQLVRKSQLKRHLPARTTAKRCQVQLQPSQAELVALTKTTSSF